MLTQAAPPKAGAKIKPALLFVDDERRVLTSMRAMFRREYEVLLANSGTEAIEILSARDHVHVVVSDQRMPEMTGVELLATVKEDYPSSMRILLTGYADLDAVEASINESEVFRYLMKPCPTVELRDAVSLAVQAARVSEMAGVDELGAVPDKELEKIELTGLVEEHTAVDTSQLALADGADAIDGYDVSYSDVDDAVADNSVADSRVADSRVADNSVTSDDLAIQPTQFRSNQTADAPVSGTQLDENLQDTISSALQDTNAPQDGDTQQAMQAAAAADDALVPVERPDPEVLVLSQDLDLLEGVSLAIGSQYAVRDADSIDSALRMLSEHPIGVLITDLAINESEIDELTRTLKHEVPELVTIIASERSDAALLIGLINHGQIFRFLLKPLQVAQTRIWLNSAMKKYADLCADSNTLLRHRVERNSAVEASNSGLFANVRARIKTIKKRFTSSLLTGLTGVRGE